MRCDDRARALGTPRLISRHAQAASVGTTKIKRPVP
jgi:hypothetical protein